MGRQQLLRLGLAQRTENGFELVGQTTETKPATEKKAKKAAKPATEKKAKKAKTPPPPPPPPPPADNDGNSPPEE